MAITTIVNFKLVDNKLEDKWYEMSANIQAGISRSEGFILRDTGKDENGNYYCIIKFESAELADKNKIEAQKKYPEMFELFNKIVDVKTMSFVRVNLK